MISTQVYKLSKHYVPPNVDQATDPSVYSESLPNPPEGKQWEQEVDGNWILVEKVVEIEEKIENPPNNTAENEEETEHNHLVASTDTLKGICLKYSVTATDIRRVNMFSGNNIQMFKYLRIPINGDNKNISIPPESKEQKAINEFKLITKENRVETILYLEEFDYDIDAALKSWREDNLFVLENHETITADMIANCLKKSIRCERKLDYENSGSVRYIWLEGNNSLLNYSSSHNKSNFKTINIAKEIKKVELHKNSILLYYTDEHIAANSTVFQTLTNKKCLYVEFIINNNVNEELNTEIVSILYHMIDDALSRSIREKETGIKKE